MKALASGNALDEEFSAIIVDEEYSLGGGESVGDSYSQDVIEDIPVVVPVHSGVMVGPDAPAFALLSEEKTVLSDGEFVTSGPLFRPGMPAKFQRKVRKEKSV